MLGPKKNSYKKFDNEKNHAWKEALGRNATTPFSPFAPLNPKQSGPALLWSRICLKIVPYSRQARFP